MGAAKDDCLQVGELLGLKTFLNEMIAYEKLSTFINNRKIFENYTAYYNSSDSWTYIKNDIYLNHTEETLLGGIMTVSIHYFIWYFFFIISPVSFLKQLHKKFHSLL